MPISRILFAHSGGVTSVLNSTAYGVITEARKQKCPPILIAQNGILGLIQNKIYDTTSLTQQDLETICQTPSSVFGSCRHKLPHYQDNPKAWQSLLQNCKTHHIDTIIYQGGNDSQDTSLKINEAASITHSPLRCYGIPKTIDNDLYGTDFSPGFPSCAKYLATSIREASLDTQAMSATSTKVFIMEVMGRHSGWLALSTAMACENGHGPDIILLPERPVDTEEYLAKTQEVVAKKGFCIVVASEGIIHKQTGKRFNQSNLKDAFGHHKLGGVAQELARLVQDNLRYKTHYSIPDYLQRSAGHIRASIDVSIAIQLGRAAIHACINKAPCALLGLERTPNNQWHIIQTPLALCANKEKTVPDNYISSCQTHISEEGKQYFAPLIQGECYPSYDQGLPQYFDPKHLQYLQQPQHCE
tara:strand:- start:865 stop:2109 length:1245 start_codon:yes stop_codon:yes gene_type:complete